MGARELRLPPLLDQLVERGRWPSDSRESLRQNLTPLVSAEQVAVIVPDETRLYLYAPPFRSVAQDVAAEISSGSSFWADHGALGELDPELALIIGDFGPGSDSPILLDYRNEPSPAVLRLAWRVNGDGPPYETATSWATIANTFAEFAEKLGLA